MPESRSSSAELWSDFLALCDCGGREAGSEGEAKALAYARRRLLAIGEAVAHANFLVHEGSLARDERPDGAILYRRA